MVYSANDPFESVLYAAVLHDIGKVWQRTKYSKSKYTHPRNLDLSLEKMGASGAHAKWSAEFFDKFFFIDETTRDAVLFHHSPENAQQKRRKELLYLFRLQIGFLPQSA